MKDPRINDLLGIHRGDPPISGSRWSDVEKALGLQLPGSYKKLIDLFGASRWREFLQILSPFDDAVNLIKHGEFILSADRVSRSAHKHHYPLPLYPEPGGLLPWATTDNGDALYFVTAGPPDDWPTLIKGPRSPELEASFLPPALLVHHIAVGTFQSTILPKL
jgi:hypothetical protein